MDFIEKSKEFAVNAHTHIDHRRKYTKQPYSVHLAAVAKLVSSVTDDEATIAAAWLHDVVEDTPATLYDVEQTFGSEIAQLVSELTDVSKPSDGNRAARKELDRQHLAKASAKAQTVKYADLIDNCNDICKNDPRFGQVYLNEMQALLDVLPNGDPALYKQACDTHKRCHERISTQSFETAPQPVERILQPFRAEASSHLIRLFSDAFTAQDIAEPLRSFDADKTCDEILKQISNEQIDIIAVREAGRISGYLRKNKLINGICSEHMHAFRQGQVIPGEASLSDVIHVLTLHQYGFITTLGEISGYFSRDNINKPIVRMWLFGILTFVEMEFMRIIELQYPNDTWQPFVSDGRLQKAKEISAERQRRNQNNRLIECLQFSDKGQILIQDDEILRQLGIDSRKQAKRLMKELESLRNNLAHAQDIVTYDWAPIVRLSYRLEATLSIRRGNLEDEGIGPA